MQVKRLTESVRQTTQHLVTAGNVMPGFLGDMSRDLDDEKRRLAAFNEHASSLQDQIRKLEAPSREEASKRLKEQCAFAAVAGERFTLDSEMAAVVDQLRLMLQKRGALSEAMRKHAEEFDLRIAQDVLDERRFEALLESLPDDLGEKSRDWAAWFCGMRAPGSLPCTVTKAVTLPESLAHNGVHAAGDVIYLTPGRAAELAASGSVTLPAEYAPARAEQGEAARA
jgi:hypothetical protein